MSAMTVSNGFRTTLWLAAALCCFVVPGGAGAKEPRVIELAQQRSEERPVAEAREVSTAAPKSTDVSQAADVAVVYRPPRRGAPSINVGAGGVRGAFAQARPLALAPDHVGLTVHASPSFFWHIDTPPSGDLDVVFTLIDEDGIKPLVERKIPSPKSVGIQRVRLDRFGVELRPGVLYEWSVALVSDDAMRPQVAVSTGYIRRVTPESVQLGSSRDAAAYAQAGLWYDALDAFGDAIDARPGDTNVRWMRNSLLRQAKLEAAVE